MRRKIFLVTALSMIFLMLCAFTVEERQDIYMVTQTVEVRETPEEQGKVIANAGANQFMLVTGVTDTGWLRVDYNGATGYAVNQNMTYLTPEALAQLLNGAAAPVQETPETAPVLPIAPSIGAKAVKINVMGDSIAYGIGTNSQTETFAYPLAAMMGAPVVNNYGISGSTVAGGNTYSAAFINRYTSMDPTADLIIFFGGTNDYKFGVRLGKAWDCTPDTFYGGLNMIMRSLKDYYPNSRIVFMTPLQRTDYTGANADGRYLSEYRDAVKIMANAYDIQVIDTYNGVDLRSNLAEYMPDGLHPNAAGHELIANYVYSRLAN